ncbi:MAG: hypothetical protein DHS20C13_30620 [Thermodesulfobacteriota bacterium]|nr:MAG: hypothetical protein DHS20C13_30620 [Thermodesulfobacteriota bacterium]
MLFEAYGDKNKYIYFDLKMCSGDLEAQMFESDIQPVDGKSLTYKTIKDNNSFLHFIKVK